MKGFKCGIGLAAAVLALALAAPAGAQENFDQGKTGAQLFAADCAICHKNPQALKKSGGLFGLSSFLREHYTASRESAATISSYLESLGNPPASGKRTGATKRTAKGDEKAKTDEKKDKPKSGEAKTSKPKSESKTESKTESKSESKSETKKEPKPKTSEPKPGEAKPAAASAAKPDKQEKSD